jgi:hypothetical protein
VDRAGLETSLIAQHAHRLAGQATERVMTVLTEGDGSQGVVLPVPARPNSVNSQRCRSAMKPSTDLPLPAVVSALLLTMRSSEAEVGPWVGRGRRRCAVQPRRCSSSLDVGTEQDIAVAERGLRSRPSRSAYRVCCERTDVPKHIVKVEPVCR